MKNIKFPDFMQSCVMTNEDAMRRFVSSGTKICSGFATSEPHTFYATLWDHIEKNDLYDLTVSQALFMAPHEFLLGQAPGATGLFPKADTGFKKKVNLASRKLQALARLIGHYEELKRRRILFVSGFVGQTQSITVPDNPVLKLRYPEYVGRNSTRMGVTDMHSVHFPEAAEVFGVEPGKGFKHDVMVAITTPPNEQGLMSHGLANGATGGSVNFALESRAANFLLYVNPKYPFTLGYKSASNTLHVDAFRRHAESGRLAVVVDDGPLPASPAGAFANPSPAELTIAENLVNHIEQNKELTHGRALQVGIGRTGLQVARLLKESSWQGRYYSEMLDPHSYALFEAGKIGGSHFIEPDGRRVQLDGKLVCTFTMGEHGVDFYEKLHENPAVVIAAAEHVVIPEAFYGGMGINNILGVDFHGHANAAGRDTNHHSGIGGSAMIFRGLARGGVGYLCLKSTHKTPEGRLRSSIFPYMPEGTPINLVGPDLTGGRDGAQMFLVTEHGVARISQRSQSEFIKALISVADPRFKDYLRKQAYKEFRVRA